MVSANMIKPTVPSSTKGLENAKNATQAGSLTTQAPALFNATGDSSPTELEQAASLSSVPCLKSWLKTVKVALLCLLSARPMTQEKASVPNACLGICCGAANAAR